MLPFKQPKRRITMNFREKPLDGWHQRQRGSPGSVSPNQLRTIAEPPAGKQLAHLSNLSPRVCEVLLGCML